MVRNFLEGNFCRPPPSGPRPFLPLPYFVYGDLLDPQKLQNVLQLDKPPALRMGIAIGFHFETWGGRTALVDGSVGNVVHGAVFDGVADEAMEKRLEAHVGVFFGKMMTFVRLDESFVADGRHRFIADGKSFRAKVFVLLKDSIRYKPDGSPYIENMPLQIV
jgi:hypothetical protein